MELNKLVSEIWIAAENWAVDQWNYDNANTDVIVTMSNGDRYVGSFFTYSNVSSLTEKNMKTGECLSGKYLWSSDMILIDRCSRTDIEKVINDLINQDELTSVFRKIENDGM